MRKTIIADLSAHIEPTVVADIVESYEEILAKHKSGDLAGALTKAGRFVEHILRAIEYIRTGATPPEIKSVSQTVKSLENQTALSESLRLLIPRVASGMIYNLRSKRDVVHVKEIDPTPIDISLAVMAASWIMAELLRLYHKSDARVVAQTMAALVRTAIPFIETINGDTFVSQRVPADTEVLLLLAHAWPGGMTRTSVGNGAKCSPASVTKSLQKLVSNRQAHLSKEKQYFITSTGEQTLASSLAKLA